MSLGLSRGSIGKILNKSPLAQARGGCRGGCRGTSCSVIWSGLIGAANVSLPRYKFLRLPDCALLRGGGRGSQGLVAQLVRAHA
jgi:hypothetical protein